MYTLLHTGEIIYYFDHKDLFDDVKHESAFMCKNIVSKDGDPLSERFAITDDEEQIFGLTIREILPVIYEAVRPLTHGIDDAISDDMLGSVLKAIPDLSGLEGVVNDDEYVVIRLQDNGAYNPNMLKIVDSSLQTAIEQGALSEFYARVVHRDLTEMSAAFFSSQVTSLTRRIVELRKKTVL